MSEHFRRQAARVIVVAIIWLCLTVALGSLVVHADQALEGLVTPSIDIGPLFGGAFVAALLLGITVRRPVVLFPLTLLMCLVASSMLAALFLAPTWSGTIEGTTPLQDFATTRALLFAALTAVPALIGALAGNLIGNLVGEWGEILPPIRNEGDEMPSWWDRRAPEETPGED